MLEEVRKVEAYIIVNNVDDSILKLNNIIEGYEFVKYTFQELEDQYSSLFYHKIDNASDKLKFDNNNIVSNSFFNKIHSSKFFNHHNIHSASAIFFRPKKIFQSSAENGLSLVDVSDYLETTRKVFNDLIIKLRLYKQGDINYLASFAIIEATREVIILSQKHMSNVHQHLYKILDNDVEILKEQIPENIVENDFTELAINNFQLSYEIANPEIRYINLITALESLFNLDSSIPIAHIVSRHTSLILSKSKDEFNKMYKDIKTMYALRSKIVHGGNKNVQEVNMNLVELQNIVRSVIWYCLKVNMNKKELFDFLNSKGYSSLHN